MSPPVKGQCCHLGSQIQTWCAVHTAHFMASFDPGCSVLHQSRTFWNHIEQFKNIHRWKAYSIFFSRDTNFPQRKHQRSSNFTQNILNYINILGAIKARCLCDVMPLSQGSKCPFRKFAIEMTFMKKIKFSPRAHCSVYESNESQIRLDILHTKILVLVLRQLFPEQSKSHNLGRI